MGVETLLLAASVAGDKMNERRAGKKRDRTLAGGIETGQRHQRRADARLGLELQRLMRSSPDVDGPFGGYIDQLDASPVPIEPGVGAANERYGGGLDAGLSEGRASNELIARLFSKIDAAGEQRRRERHGIARTGSDIRGIAREAEGDDYLTRLRASRIRKNPWVSALTSVGKGVALGGMGGGSGLSMGDGGLFDFYGASP